MKKIYTVILFATLAVASYAQKPAQDSLMLRNTITQYGKDKINVSLNYPQLNFSNQTADSIKYFASILNGDVCKLLASITPTTDSMTKDSLWKNADSPAKLELYVLGAAKNLFSQMKNYGIAGTYDMYSEWTAFGNAHIVSIFLEAYLFTGGAHGIIVGRVLNYDSQTGQRIDLVKEIKDTAAMVDLAAEYFCKERKLPKNSLKLRTGLFYELADLPFPDQVGFSSSGMILYYDPYSIAPYSFGPITITVPYRELDDVLSDDFYKMKVATGGAKTYNAWTKAKYKELKTKR